MLPILQKFSSIQNRILIDYKAFRDWVRRHQVGLGTGDGRRKKDYKAELAEQLDTLKDRRE